MVKLPLPFSVQAPITGQDVVLVVTAIVTLLFDKAAEITLAAELLMMRSIGSSNHVPVLPLLAPVLI